MLDITAEQLHCLFVHAYILGEKEWETQIRRKIKITVCNVGITDDSFL